MAIEILSQRLVAFLDVLGFSTRVANTPLREIHAEYVALIDEARTKVFDSKDMAGQPHNNFASARFVFDSLVLVSHGVDGPAGAHAAFRFVSAVCLLLELSFSRCLPLRGCIGQGDVLEDVERGVVLSPVFKSLLATEKMFNWSGVVVLPEHAETLLRLLHVNPPQTVAQSASHFLVRYPAPAKSGAPTEWWCVNWLHLLSDADLNAGFAYLDEAKRVPTQTFLAFLNTLPNQTHELPEKFRPATHVRFVVASSGMRMKFADEVGNGVDPPDGVTMEIALVVGRTAGEQAG